MPRESITILPMPSPRSTIHPIDLNFQETPGLIAAYLILSGNEAALIETGPESTLTHLQVGLSQHGLKPSDIRNVFVTHVHLDHAGAAGWWAEQGAQVHVHASGARHLIDPSRLWQGASEIYGDKMEALWAHITPAPAGRVTVMADGETMQIGDIEIKAWDTPGHARHHLAFSIGDECFTGDVAGCRLAFDRPFISLTGAPPQFDLTAYQTSVARLQAASFSTLHLTHFGTLEGKAAVLQHWKAYAEVLKEHSDYVRIQLERKVTPDRLRPIYATWVQNEAFTADIEPEEWLDYERVNPAAMTADGIRLYLEKSSSPS